MLSKRIGSLICAVCLLSLLVLAGCQEATDEAAGGQEAFVDTVAITESDNQPYAKVAGNFPDPCTRVSKVEQRVQGNTISINLFVAAPEGLVCAQMLAPFTVDILVATGGLPTGDYTVIVNNGPSATLSLEAP